MLFRSQGEALAGVLGCLGQAEQGGSRQTQKLTGLAGQAAADDQVDAAAGLPAAVTGRAGEVLRALEEGREGHKPLARIDDLPLFAPPPRGAPPVRDEIGEALKAALNKLDPDALSPKDALEELYRLKILAAKNAN